MATRAVTTIIGTLFFVMIASMLIVLMIRALYIYGELASKLTSSMAQREDFSSDIRVAVIYSVEKPVLASSIVSVEVLQGSSSNTDPSLLDFRDERCIEVEAESVGGGGGGEGEVELIKNGNFSEGLSYWNYSGSRPWRITYVNGDPAAYYWYLGKSDTASIWQEFAVDSAVASASLSFSYISSTWGFPTRFRLTVSILRDGSVVWSKRINLLENPEGNPRYDVSTALSAPGSYTLRFTIEMQSSSFAAFTFILDNVSLIARFPVAPATPGAAYVALVRISAAGAGLGVNGTLTLRFNNTAILKVFVWAGDRWRLYEEDIGLPGQWFNTTLSEDSLLQAYSTVPFLMELDYLALTVESLTNATLVLTNKGGGEAQVYAAWLRNSTWEQRISRYMIILPGESATLQFNTTLTPGCRYEVRVVTATRVISEIVNP